VLGAVLGLALAIPAGLSPTMRQMLNPYAVALQVTPRIAIAPLIIAWAGFGYSSKIWIAAIIAFFPVYVNALTGIITVDEDAREMFRSLGASRWQAFVYLMVPGSLPVMFAGLKTAAGLSLVGAVVGEFISAERGLGVLVQQFSSQLAISDAFAVILMLMLLGLLLYAVMEWLERTTVFWLHDNRLVARSRRRAARAKKKHGRDEGVSSKPSPTLAGRG
jgi:NitT/TauT family transport system permease protein